MSPFKSKEEFDYGEATECETLYTELSFRQENQRKRMISIGVIEHDAIGKNGTISFQLVTFYPNKGCDVATADLTEEEIDVVIKGLKDARERMRKYKMKYDDSEEPEVEDSDEGWEDEDLDDVFEDDEEEDD